MRRLLDDPSIRLPLSLFLFARITTSLLGIVMWLFNLPPKSIEAFTWPLYGETPPVVTGLEGMLLGIWQRYDTLYYLVIATIGYFNSQLTVFPPGFPFLIRIVSYLTTGNMLLAAFIVANVACLLLLICLYRLVQQEGMSDATAGRAVLYLLFYPTAIFLLVPYTESTFVLLTVLTFLLARRGQWGWAALAGFGASLVRLQGICLSLVIAWEMLTQTEWKPLRLSWRLLLAAAPAVAVGGFFAWRVWAGHPNYTELQVQFWDQVPALPFASVLETIWLIIQGQAPFSAYLDLTLTLLTIGLGVLVTRRLPFSYSLYFWAAFIFTLTRVTAGNPLASQSRYLLTLFPTFIALAQVTERPWLNRLVLYPSIALWLTLTGVYIMGGFIG